MGTSPVFPRSDDGSSARVERGACCSARRHACVLGLVLFFLFFPFCRDLAAATLEARVRAIFGRYDIKDHMIGVVVQDQNTREILLDIHGDEPKIPASNQKLAVTFSVLKRLGSDFTFQTVLYRRKDALILEGRGDPNLSGRFHDDPLVPFREMIRQARRKGLPHSVRVLYVDDDYFDSEWLHPDWPKDQIAKWYCAEAGALSFHDNCVLLRVVPGHFAGQAAAFSVTPDTRYVQVVNRCQTTSNRSHHRLVFGRTRSSNRIHITGAIWQHAKPYEQWVTVHDPGMYAGVVFAELLRAQGIAIAEGVRRLPRDDDGAGKMVAKWESSLCDSVRVCNKRSQNFYAEQLLKTLGREVHDTGSFQAGSRVVSEVLQEIDIPPRWFVIADGSGLSRNNRMAPHAMVRLLQHAREEACFMASLPSNGEPETTLRNRMAGAYEGCIRAKGGHILKVNCLSGFLRTRRGRALIFSIMINHFQGPSYRVNEAIDRICLDMVEKE